MFGKKQTVESILKDIEKLSDKEKEQLLASLNGQDDETEADETENLDETETEQVNENAEQGTDEVETEDLPDETEPDTEETDDIPEEAEDEGVEDVADVEDEDELDEAPEVDTEPTQDANNGYKEILDRLTALEQKIDGFIRTPKEADEKTSSKLEEMIRKYN